MYHRLLVACATLSACAWLLGACASETDSDACADNPFCGTEGSSDDAQPEPPGVCTDGTRWESGDAIFMDATGAWDIEALEITGNRLTVVDFDGDGLPDIAARVAGSKPSLFNDEFTEWNHWLLRNTGAGFEDVTVASGLWAPRGEISGQLRAGDMLVFGDVDNDGDLDAYVGVDTEAPDANGARSELMVNLGDGTFATGTARNPMRRDGQLDAPGGAAFVDINRDGWLDLWVARNVTGNAFVDDSLYRNDPDGFVDATAELGLTTVASGDIDTVNSAGRHSRAWSAAACDLNDDGDPELLAASYGRAPNHLWQATETGYINRSVASGYAYDDDLTWNDNQMAACFCRDNPDEPGCADAITPAIDCQSARWNHVDDREAFRLGGNSGTTVCADIDNDGHLDLLTTEIRHWWAGEGSDESSILRNTGADDVTLERLSRDDTGFIVPHVTSNGWDEGHITAAVFDADNDGWKDLYIGASEYAGNRGLLYMQRGPMQFELVDEIAAPEHNRAQGVIPADFDGDGDLDLLIGHSRNRCGPPNDCYETSTPRLFENVIGDQGNWIQLDLLGAEGTNRRAIGARVEVRAGDLLQVQEVGGGFGHYGMQAPLTQHFGLGTNCEAEVTVRWPNAELTEQTFRVAAGVRYVVEQGEEPTVFAR